MIVGHEIANTDHDEFCPGEKAEIVETARPFDLDRRQKITDQDPMRRYSIT
jgi:hypothetical protein